jgi:hypothetical protein
MPKTVIFLITFLISSSLHCMEIIKKQIRKKDNANNNYFSITNELLFTHTMHTKNIIPRDVTKLIEKYCTEIRMKEFIRNERLLLRQWNDCRIPPVYLFFLTHKQMNLIQELLIKRNCYIVQNDEKYHVLESKKEYKLFLTLPITLRRCLTFLSRFDVDILSAFDFSRPTDLDPDTLIPINPTKTIQIKNQTQETILRYIKNNYDARHMSIKHKLIVPEEQEKEKSQK